MQAFHGTPDAYVEQLDGWRRELAREAVALNARLGDPTALAKA
jgi:hypothetical protein